MMPTEGRTSVLALDLGTRTGWALRVGRQVAHGHVDLRPSRYEGGGMRFLRFRRWLDEMHAGHGIAEVHFEEVRRHAGTDAAHVYGGLLATLSAWCEERSIPYQGAPVGSIKRHITGRGNAGKQEVIDAVIAAGHGVSNHDEADAVALLLMVAEQ